MDDLIDALHDAAQELLGKAEELEASLGKNPTSASSDTVKRVSELLSGLCKALTQVDKHLGAKGSPLGKIVEGLNGVIHEVSVKPDDAKRKIADFLATHRTLLVDKVHLPKSLIDMVEKELRATVSADNSKLMTEKHAFDAAAIKTAISDFKEVVCKLAGDAHLLELVWDPELLKPVVKGVIGACTIIVDVTAAATAPDITGTVLFHAIKSTASGGQMVYKAVNSIKRRWDEWKAALKAKEQQDNLKRNAPKTKLKKP